jgi:hypothetical protein
MCQMLQVQQKVSVIVNSGLERVGESKIKLKVVPFLWKDAYGGKY